MVPEVTYSQPVQPVEFVSHRHHSVLATTMRGSYIILRYGDGHNNLASWQANDVEENDPWERYNA